MDVFGMDFGFSNEQVYYHNNFHNFNHNWLTCWVVSGEKNNLWIHISPQFHHSQVAKWTSCGKIIEIVVIPTYFFRIYVVDLDRIPKI